MATFSSRSTRCLDFVVSPSRCLRLFGKQRAERRQAPWFPGPQRHAAEEPLPPLDTLPGLRRLSVPRQLELRDDLPSALRKAKGGETPSAVVSWASTTRCGRTFTSARHAAWTSSSPRVIATRLSNRTHQTLSRLLVTPTPSQNFVPTLDIPVTPAPLRCLPFVPPFLPLAYPLAVFALEGASSASRSAARGSALPACPTCRRRRGPRASPLSASPWARREGASKEKRARGSPDYRLV